MFATIDDVGSILGTATWCTRAAGSMFAGAEGEHGMKIKWYGHACFRVEGGGVSIVTDPYTPEVAGLDPVEEPADVVIMSSATDRFHSNAAMVPGDPKILKRPGDRWQGTRRGERRGVRGPADPWRA